MKSIKQIIAIAVTMLVFIDAGEYSRASILPESAKPEELTIDGRVVAMSGSCNALRCPVIAYKIETFEIVSNSLFPEKSDYELAGVSACGESGLKLGVEYRFILKRTQSELASDFDKPISADGQYLQCDVYFETTPTPSTGKTR